MINEQKEIWISTGHKANSRHTIIAVSNCGRIMRKNGKIEIASYGQQVYVGEKRSRMLIYRFLAATFITKTEDDILHQRTVIDHISHAPTNMHINDIRNLRWCTQKENCNFKEAKLNQSKAKIGEKHPMYGKHHSEEAKEKMSAAKIGEKHPMYGKKRSEEAKAKISAAQKGNTTAKGRHWYNNCVRSVFTYECPPGFTSGRI